MAAGVHLEFYQKLYLSPEVLPVSQYLSTPNLVEMSAIAAKLLRFEDFPTWRTLRQKSALNSVAY